MHFPGFRSIATQTPHTSVAVGLYVTPLSHALHIRDIGQKEPKSLMLSMQSYGEMHNVLVLARRVRHTWVQ